MGKVISTVRAVTTDEPGGRFGLTVSSMSSVTIEPPSMLVCIHGGSPVVVVTTQGQSALKQPGSSSWHQVVFTRS